VITGFVLHRSYAGFKPGKELTEKIGQVQRARNRFERPGQAVKKLKGGDAVSTNIPTYLAIFRQRLYVQRVWQAVDNPDLKDRKQL
jgi:hypothetical protein